MKLFGHFIVGALLLLTISGCVKSPVMPTWVIDLDFPLLNDYFYVSDLVDTVNFFQDGNEVYFSSNGSVDSFLLNNLRIQPNTQVSIPLISGNLGTGAMSFESVVSTDQVKVAYGEIINGTLLVTTHNIVSGFQSADITFDELYTPDGQHFQIHIPNTTNSMNVSLAGLFVGTESNTTIIDSLHYSVDNHSSLPALTPLGELNMELNQVVRFDNFVGIMNNFLLNVENETTSINIEYPMGIENAIQVNDASLQLNLLNEIGFECELHGKLYAFNDSTGQSRSIDILDDNGNPFVLAAATSETSPTSSTFILHNGLNELTSIIPTRFTIMDAFFILGNDTQTLGFAHIGQRITGTYIEKVPFNFTLFESQIIPSRIDSLEITQENRDRIRNNINEATLIIKAKNTLPIGAGVEIHFSDSLDVFNNPRLVRSATIQSCLVDSTYQEIPITLSYADLQFFDNPKIYYKTKINIHPTDGPVIIHGSSSDYIQIIGRIRMNALVEEK